MPASEPLCDLFKLDISILTKKENTLFEAELFIFFCEELKEEFRKQHKHYFQIMRFSLSKENNMLEAKFAQLIINDIISTKNYSLKGIAHYTGSFEDVLEEIMLGRNTNPSAIFLQRLISLHRSVRQELYEVIMKKIITRYSSA